MEIPALIENILRHNGLLRHIPWVTLVKSPAASTCFPGGVSMLVLGLVITLQSLPSQGCTASESQAAIWHIKDVS